MSCAGVKINFAFIRIHSTAVSSQNIEENYNFFKDDIVFA